MCYFLSKFYYGLFLARVKKVFLRALYFKSLSVVYFIAIVAFVVKSNIHVNFMVVRTNK